MVVSVTHAQASKIHLRRLYHLGRCHSVGLSNASMRFVAQVLMNWNQEELEQWAVTQQQKEDDNAAIEGYHAQDESKVKELKLAVECMSKTVAARKAELDGEVTATQAAQVQLDKAADDFMRLHKVRTIVNETLM